MSKYNYDKYISNRSDFHKRDDADRVDFGAGFSSPDTYNAFSSENCVDGCTGGTYADIASGCTDTSGGSAVRSLSGVNCEAANCKYHHPGGHCSATGITVEAPDADSKSDTFCNTFKPNSAC